LNHAMGRYRLTAIVSRVIAMFKSEIRIPKPETIPKSESQMPETARTSV